MKKIKLIIAVLLIFAQSNAAEYDDVIIMQAEMSIIEAKKWFEHVEKPSLMLSRKNQDNNPSKVILLFNVGIPIDSNIAEPERMELFIENCITNPCGCRCYGAEYETEGPNDHLRFSLVLEDLCSKHSGHGGSWQASVRSGWGPKEKNDATMTLVGQPNPIGP